MRNLPPPFWEKVPEIFSFPFRGQGLFAVLGLGIFGIMMKLLPGLGVILTTGLTFTFLFNIIRTVGQGKENLPPFAEYFDYWDSVILPNIRGSLAYGLIFAPLIFYLLLAKDWSTLKAWDFKSFVNFAMDPMFVILGALGVFYFPMATCLAAINENVLHMINPVIGFNLIRKTFASYTVLVLFICGITFLSWLASASIEITFAMLHMPGLGKAMRFFSNLYFSTISAVTMGYWVYQNGETLGYLDASFYETQPKFLAYSGQSLAGTTPRPPLIPSDLLADEISLAEIKQSEGSMGEAMQIYRDLHVRFPEDARPLLALFSIAALNEDQAKISEYANSLLEQAVKAGDPKQVIQTYQKIIPFGPSIEIGLQTLYETGQIFYRNKAYGFAAKVWMHMGFLQPYDSKTTKGLLMLGDVYIDQFSSPDRALKLFELLDKMLGDSVFNPQIKAGLQRSKRLMGLN